MKKAPPQTLPPKLSNEARREVFAGVRGSLFQKAPPMGGILQANLDKSPLLRHNIGIDPYPKG